MIAALEGGEWSAARPDRTLPPGKTRYPFYRRLGGSQGRSGRAENLVPTGIRSRTVQPVVSSYTDWATGPTIMCYVLLIMYYVLRIMYLSFTFNITIQYVLSDELYGCPFRPPAGHLQGIKVNKSEITIVTSFL